MTVHWFDSGRSYRSLLQLLLPDDGDDDAAKECACFWSLSTLSIVGGGRFVHDEDDSGGCKTEEVKPRAPLLATG